MTPPTEKIEKLLKELNEPIHGHPSRESEIRAKRNERILKQYLELQLESLNITGKTL